MCKETKGIVIYVMYLHIKFNQTSNAWMTFKNSSVYYQIKLTKKCFGNKLSSGFIESKK